MIIKRTTINATIDSKKVDELLVIGGRIATALEGLLYEVNPHRDATTEGMSKEELERNDNLEPWQEEWAAMVEQLEDQGVKIPAMAYKVIGLEPPSAEVEPSQSEFDAPQPGSAHHDGIGISEPVSSRDDDDE